MVHTRNGAVTCFELIAQLHHFFQGELGREEWQGVGGERRHAMKTAYQRRTGHRYSESVRMKRVDYLLGKTKFESIVPVHGDMTLLLQTTSS